MQLLSGAHSLLRRGCKLTSWKPPEPGSRQHCALCPRKILGVKLLNGVIPIGRYHPRIKFRAARLSRQIHKKMPWREKKPTHIYFLTESSFPPSAIREFCYWLFFALQIEPAVKNFKWSLPLLAPGPRKDVTCELLIRFGGTEASHKRDAEWNGLKVALFVNKSLKKGWRAFAPAMCGHCNRRMEPSRFKGNRRRD